MCSCSTKSLHDYPNTQQAPESDSCTHKEQILRCVELLEVYDGDTIFITIPDFHPLFGRRIGVRILGIDTPEMRSNDPCEKKAAKIAKNYLLSLLSNAQRIDITNIERDKYFRILGSVVADGKSVAEELMKQKMAYPYFGEKKPVRDWCR